MMDKDWVHLNRTTREYGQGAWNFVHAAKRNMVDVEKILCPCLGCRNLSRHHEETIVEHLIIKGMDPVYKSGMWYNHGELKDFIKMKTSAKFKVRKFANESQSSSTRNVKEDAISQVLGQDRPGRLRAMGRGATYTKFLLSQVKDQQTAQLRSRISKLEEEVRKLSENQFISYRREECKSQSNCGKIYDKCDLLDCFGIDEIVAEGRIVSNDPNELVCQIPIGPNAMKILIEVPRKLDAFLWRPVPNTIHIGKAKDMVVAWPADRVVLHTMDRFDKADNLSETNSVDHKCKLYDWTGSEELVAEGRLYSSDPNQLVNDIPLGPSAVLVSIDNPKKLSAYLWRPTLGMIYVKDAVGSKVAWLESKVVVEKVDAESSSTNPADAASSHSESVNYTSINKCKLIDVGGSGEVVAEGRVDSTNPNDLAHFIPLGRNAVRVLVDIVKIPKAILWRQSSEFKFIEDVVGSSVAWPAAKVVMESSSRNC